MMRRLGLVGLTTLLIASGGASRAEADGQGTATLDGIDLVAVAEYSCSTDRVEVEPTAMTPLDGNYPVWSYGYVWDTASQR